VSARTRSRSSCRNAAFSIVEYKVGPRFVAPPVLHWHEDTDWAGVVLEGKLQFRFEDRTQEIAPLWAK